MAVFCQNLLETCNDLWCSLHAKAHPHNNADRAVTVTFSGIQKQCLYHVFLGGGTIDLDRPCSGSLFCCELPGRGAISVLRKWKLWRVVGRCESADRHGGYIYRHEASADVNVFLNLYALRYFAVHSFCFILVCTCVFVWWWSILISSNYKNLVVYWNLFIC